MDKHEVAKFLGSLGGKKGGKARAAALAPAARKKIAQQGAKARWAKYRAEQAKKPKP